MQPEQAPIDPELFALCPQGHPVVGVVHSKWLCAGTGPKGECKSAYTHPDQTKDKKSFWCQICDYNLCELCHDECPRRCNVRVSLQQLEVLKQEKVRWRAEKAKLQDEKSRALAKASRLQAELNHVKDELQKLSGLSQVRKLQAMRFSTEHTLARVAPLGGDAAVSLLPGLSAWFQGRNLGGASVEVFRWCAANRVLNVHDLIFTLFRLGEAAAKSESVEERVEKFDKRIDYFAHELGVDKVEMPKLRQMLQREQLEHSERQRAAEATRKRRQVAGKALVEHYGAKLGAAQRHMSQLESTLGGEDLGESPPQLVQARAEARRLKGSVDRAHAATTEAAVSFVVASAPVRGVDGFNICNRVTKLSQETQGLVVACDWPGSIRAREEDKAVFDKTTRLTERWKESDSAERIVDQICELVKHTIWFQLWKSGVRGALRSSLLSGHDVVTRAVCIQGGPVSRAEAKIISEIAQEAVVEAGIAGRENATIEIVHFSSIGEFEEALRAHDTALSKLDEGVPRKEGRSADDGGSPASPAPDEMAEVLDAQAARWKQRADLLRHANEHLWVELTQPVAKRAPWQASDLLLLHLEADSLLRKTIEVRRRFLQRRTKRAASTGALPRLSASPSSTLVKSPSKAGL